MFQSTPSGGKATNRGRTYFGPLSEFQSTPSGGKATCGQEPAATRLRAVSIHAFRGEGDFAYLLAALPAQFQSTPSGGKATHDCADRVESAHVSIHAFRGEGDRSRRT